MPGYSGKPLAAKLGIKADTQIRLAGAPPDYLPLISPLPPGVTLVDRVSRETALVHFFSASRSELAGALKKFRAKLPADAVVWVSWPKKSSKVPTEVTEDVIRAVALPLGFVDIKVCAVTDVWSGLKLMVRRELR